MWRSSIRSTAWFGSDFSLTQRRKDAKVSSESPLTTRSIPSFQFSGQHHFMHHFEQPGTKLPMHFNGGFHHYLAYLILRHLGLFASLRETWFPNANQ